MISVFKGGQVRVNFGPFFKNKLKMREVRPLSERLLERTVEDYVADMYDDVEFFLGGTTATSVPLATTADDSVGK